MKGIVCRAARLAKVIDLKAARQDPDGYRAALARREAEKDFDELLAADARWREATEHAESLRAEQKRASKGKPGPDELAQLKELSARIELAMRQQADAAQYRDEMLARIPNLPDPTAADGMDEEDAQLVRTWGQLPEFGFEPKDHLELGSARGWIDMARGARLSGSRFAYRIGDVARHRDGALPVRAGQAARQGVPDRCCRRSWSASGRCTAPVSCRPRSPTCTGWSGTTCT